MEYSLYINQVKAVEWGLSMGEAHVFGYLISSSTWMKRYPEAPDYCWGSNAKIAAELPLVCTHEGSLRRHMSSLEHKGLIKRLVVTNKSYFRITEKGLEWKTPTRLMESQAKQDGLAKPNKMVRPSQTDRFDNQITNDQSTKEQKEKDAGKPADPLGLTIEIEQQIVDAYHEILPECPRVSAKGWAQSQTRKNLHKRWRADKRCRSVDFWEGFFDVVRHKSFWMTGNAGKPIEQMRLAWLLGPKPYDDVLTLATEIAEDSA